MKLICFSFIDIGEPEILGRQTMLRIWLQHLSPCAKMFETVQATVKQLQAFFDPCHLPTLPLAHTEVLSGRMNLAWLLGVLRISLEKSGEFSSCYNHKTPKAFHLESSATTPFRWVTNILTLNHPCTCNATLKMVHARCLQLEGDVKTSQQRMEVARKGICKKTFIS